jgi:hypothetical protein
MAAGDGARKRQILPLADQVPLQVDPGLRENASLEELEAEMKKHWKRLAPVLDYCRRLWPARGFGVLVGAKG